MLVTPGSPLPGTPFGSGATPDAPEHGYPMALDGDTGTYFSSSLPTGDYAGIDLGSQIKLNYFRFFPHLAAEMNGGKFIGSNQKPATINVLAKVETSDGRSVTYDYQMLNDPGLPVSYQMLSAAHYGDGTAASYTYQQVLPSTRPLMVAAVDPRVLGSGTNLKWQYYNTTSNAIGFVQKELNGLTGETMVTISSVNSYTPLAIYANGGQRIFGVNEKTSLPEKFTDAVGQVSNFTYDQNRYGLLTSRKDPLGRTTTYTRSTYGNLLTTTHPDGLVETWTRDSLDLPLSHTKSGPGLAARTTTWTRDAQHRITRTVYPDGSDETFAYNSFGQVTSHRLRNGGTETSAYGPTGLLTTRTDALGQAAAFTYHASGLPASSTDPDGHATTFEYNERGRVTKRIHADLSFQTYAYDAFGNRTGVTDEIGNQWLSAFDEFKRLISQTDPLGRVTLQDYTLPGQACGCTHAQGQPTSITLPSGRVVKNAYDAEWQKVSTTAGFGTADAATTVYSYDAAGNLKDATDPRGQKSTFTYDSRNRRTVATDPLGNTTRWSYDLLGNMLTETRPDAGVVANAYDVMNRLVSTTDPKNQTTSYTYGGTGAGSFGNNLLTLTDARGSVTTFAYDLQDRRVAKTYADGAQEHWAYDAAGNLSAYTAPGGQVQTCTYDARNRKVLADWSDATPDVASTYDAAGRLLTLSSSVSALSYTYDAANQLLSETQALQAPAGLAPQTVTYSYDLDGQRSGMVYPGGTAMAYTYTGRNQIATISADGPPPLATYTYDLAGNRVSKALENGTSASYTYDSANRLLSLDHRKGAVSFGKYDYGYNAINNRTSRAESLDGGAAVSDGYTYDAADQVTAVTYGSGRNVSYAYDAAGNRTSVVDASVTTPYTANNLNQYTAIDSLAAPTYDVAGNTLSIQYPPVAGVATSATWTYQWDAQNRLIGGSDGTTNFSFAYDGRNRCVTRTISGVTTADYYDGWSLIEERDSTGALLAKHLRGAMLDEILCTIRNVGGTSDTRFHHHDGLGSVIALTDETGAVTERVSYDIYGLPTFRDAAGVPLASSPSNNRHFFTGREWFPTLHLADHRNRYYAPEVGRWVNRDPINEEGGINLYAYVGNNPVNAVDPYGLWSFYKWLYTGDGNISDEIYDEALDAAADYTDCYSKCMADVNKKGLALAAGAVGALPIPKPLVGVWPGPNQSMLTGKTRLASMASRAVSGNSAATKALNRAAQGVKKAPLRAAVRGGVAGVCIAETAAAAYCAKKCSSSE